MARKVVSRRELRAEADAAEAREAAKPKKAPAKKAAKRKSRAKEPVQERMKLMWESLCTTTRTKRKPSRRPKN